MGVFHFYHSQFLTHKQTVEFCKTKSNNELPHHFIVYFSKLQIFPKQLQFVSIKRFQIIAPTFLRFCWNRMDDPLAMFWRRNPGLFGAIVAACPNGKRSLLDLFIFIILLRPFSFLLLLLLLLLTPTCQPRQQGYTFSSLISVANGRANCFDQTGPN